MPAYAYKVRDKEGKVLNGQMDAADDRDLRRKLSERDYFLIDYARQKSGKEILSQPILLVPTRANATDLSIVSWQLFTLLDAGLTLSNSLTLIINQTKNTAIKTAFAKVYQQVESGSTFANALKENPSVFSKFYVQMVNAGEVGGVLDEMLKRLAVFYERRAEINSKIKSAMIYPLMLLLISFCVIIFLVTFVLPQFSEIFKGLGVALPLPTRILLGLSTTLKTYWYLLAASVAGIIFFFKIIISTEQGGYQFDLFLLRLPVIGGLINKSVTVQLTQTLATLVSAGIPILTALDVATDTINNRAIARVLKKVSTFVEEGKPIAQPLEESKMFPDMLVNMVRVGEETGSLSKMLEKISEFYFKDVYNAIEIFTKMIEPALMLGMAVIIGFITSSIFLPLATLLQTIH